MIRIIHHIRRQPENVKRHILHLITGIFAVVLLFFWVYSLGTNINDKSIQTKISNDLKPFSALKNNLVGGYINIANPTGDAQ